MDIDQILHCTCAQHGNTKASSYKGMHSTCSYEEACSIGLTVWCSDWNDWLWLRFWMVNLLPLLLWLPLHISNYCICWILHAFVSPHSVAKKQICFEPSACTFLSMWSAWRDDQWSNQPTKHIMSCFKRQQAHWRWAEHGSSQSRVLRIQVTRFCNPKLFDCSF